jgi:hypothetical protein
MKEGWSNDSYFIVFDNYEVEQISEAYGIGDYIPGYRIVALKGWDDFVVEKVDGQ